MKQCPHCQREIRDAATVCEFCWRDVVDDPGEPSSAGTGCIVVMVTLVVLTLGLFVLWLHLSGINLAQF